MRAIVRAPVYDAARLLRDRDLREREGEREREFRLVISRRGSTYAISSKEEEKKNEEEEEVEEKEDATTAITREPPNFSRRGCAPRLGTWNGAVENRSPTRAHRYP